MKILKKMLLIKWYYIEHQMINFESINFMTGKNASGKSTIIDALQIVMLGDTRGNFFNKAANDKGGRTLDGYLKGEISDDESLGYKSKRSGRFTSYIATEFFDTVEKKSFTCGIVFDSYPDAPTDHMFFILNDAIPENHFIDEEKKTAMSYKELKTYFSKNYSASKFKTFKESNKSYQQEFLAKMGAIKPKFFNLFKKSVTFTPIDDIEKFISEYVCDVTNEIDIESMKQNIRQYKELEKQALQMQERIQELRKIEGLFKNYEEKVNEKVMQNYFMLQSNLQIDLNYLEKSKKQYESNLQLLKNLENELEEIARQKKVTDSKIEEKSIEKNSSDIGKKQAELEKKIEEKQAELTEILNSTEGLIKIIKNKISRWKVNIENLLENKNKLENTEILESITNLKDNITYLMQLDESNISTLEETTLSETSEYMKTVNEFSNKIYFNKNKEAEELEGEKEKLTVEIKNLKTGIKPYEQDLLEFRKILQNELENKFSEKVEVQILADLLEIKNEKWKNAIQCYINHQMFYLIIDPKYYDEAARIYKRLSINGNYSGIGIVNIEAIQKLNINIETNSLAEEIETENEFARAYIEYLLGKVIKCEEVDELKSFRTAITADCMLYKNYVLRKIADKRGEFNFIGKKSIAEQVETKQMKLEEIEKRILEIQKMKEIFRNLKDVAMFSMEEIRYILKDIDKIRQKEGIIKQKEEYEKELNSLDLSWLNKITEEIERLKDQQSNMDKQIQQLVIKKALTDDEQRALKNSTIPQLEQEIDKKAQEIEMEFTKEWIEEKGKNKFEEVAQSRKVEQISKTASKIIEKLKEEINIQRNELVKEKSEYNKKYDFSYDINDDSNKEFLEELEKLDRIELPQYIEKIKDSREKAYEQFREDFISKLKANIDEVENQIEELNDALKNSQFGVDKYHFTVKPKQEYKRFYEMITDPMLMEGQNLWSEAFNTKYSEEIKELFEKLADSDVYHENYQKNISLYTDYKTYLSFDLIVTDQAGDKQRLSRTLDKKSGGETQTPFYISILASFAQLYRINKNRYDNTLRLIVFDEAFNKMDEERMKESLSLLGKFGFQAIIAAPSEKAGEIIPLVKNTLCVIRKGRDTVVREWTRDKDYLAE